MVHQYSHTESCPHPHPPTKNTQGPHSHHEHLCARQTDVRRGTCPCPRSPVGPVTSKPKQQDPSVFSLFILCTSKHLFLSVGVCILHMSALSVLWTLLFFFFLIWILLILWGFILHVGWERKGRGSEQFIGRNTHPLKVPKMQLHSLDDEVADGGVGAVFTHLVCPVLAVVSRSINQFVSG